MKLAGSWPAQQNGSTRSQPAGWLAAWLEEEPQNMPPYRPTEKASAIQPAWACLIRWRPRSCGSICRGATRYRVLTSPGAPKVTLVLQSGLDHQAISRCYPVGRIARMFLRARAAYLFCSLSGQARSHCICIDTALWQCGQELYAQCRSSSLSSAIAVMPPPASQVCAGLPTSCVMAAGLANRQGCCLWLL